MSSETVPNSYQKDSAQEQPSRPYAKWQWAMVLPAIYCSTFLYGLDATIVADIQVYVVEDFDTLGKLGWLGVGYPLGGIAVLLTIGKLYGTFDVKWVYFISLAMFTAGSALCGGAPNIAALIIGRVWAGAGGAGMYLGVLNLISINTSLQERPVYIAATGIVWGAGSILGPVIGGAFASSPATWRWSFYLNLVLFALFAPICVFVLRSVSFRPNTPLVNKLKSIDWVGAVLNAGVYTFFVIIFALAGIEWTWDDGRIIALFVLFGVFLCLFVASQYFEKTTTKENRLFPGDFLKSRSMVLLHICQASAAAILYVPIFYIPLYFQFAHGDTGLESSVRLLPLICIGVAACMFQGALMPRYGYYMPWFFSAGVFAIIGGALMYATVDARAPPARIYGYSVLLAFGGGLCQVAAYSVAQARVAPNRVPDAVGFINTAQIGGIVIALTAASSIFQNVGYQKVATVLHGSGFNKTEIRSALSGQRSVVFAQIPKETGQLVIDGIVSAICDAYIVVIFAGAACLVSSAFLKREKLIMTGAAGG